MNVHDSALAGERVEAGALLFSIEKTPYESALAAAELNLEQAKLAFVHAQNDTGLAREEAELLNVSEPNDLVLRLPQLRIAERTLASAEAQLADARRQLADTDVTAPFSGIITNRMASLGQTVAVGEALLHLSDDRQYELAVELNEADWALLEHPIAGQAVRLFHRNGTQLGAARIRQGGGYLDSQTRQPRIFLEVANPNEGLVAGDFVRVEFTGRAIADTLTLPEAALSRAGHIWIVDADVLLVRLAPEILFRADGDLVIATPEGAGPWRVAATPLASFLPGMKVAPQTLNEGVATGQLANRQVETTPNVQNRR
ncbi:MAG: efflux RND transporter periplasmic adaptor subunit [Pseudomonadota bacterium]